MANIEHERRFSGLSRALQKNRPSPFRAVSGIGVLAVVVVSLACGSGLDPQKEGRPADLNIILITIDTLRADFVGAYGGLVNTPTLDRLAADGVVFERCISQTPLTLPSHTTILSGTYPNHHGVRDNGGYVVPDDLDLVSETLQSHGYATGAFVGAYVLHSKWGLDQGFDHYSDTFDRGRYGHLRLQNSKRADEVLAAAREWIDNHRNQPFFSWIHLFDPHTPYEPPPPFDAASSSPYRGEVEFTDHVLGGFVEFLQERGLLDRSVVIVTADHGEGLGEHGEREHGFFVYDSTVRVPLIVRLPFEPPVQRWGGLVELVDIVPTILDGLHIEASPNVQGRSLWPVFRGDGIDAERPGYSETFYPRLHYGWSELRALYHRDIKLVEAPRPELFDLRADTGEHIDLALDPASSDDLEMIRSELHRRVELLSKEALVPSAAAMTRHDRLALEALGYVTTTVDAEDQLSLADPKDKIGVFDRLTDAAGMLRENRNVEAAAIATEIVRTDPHLVDAHVLLGNANRRLGRLDEAIKNYRRTLELKPDANFAMIDLMACLMDSGAYTEAVQEGQIFLRVFPEDPILHEQLGYAYASDHDNAAALRHLERSSALRPDGMVLAKIGELHFNEKSYVLATARLQQALDLDDATPNAWYLLGRVADAEGRKDEALVCFQNEVAHHPDAFMAAFNAALILAEGGRREEALRYCEKAIAGDPPFGLPYFMIAADHLAQGTKFDEAIELCRTGIGVAPKDRNLLIGYEILLQLLQKTGNRSEFERTAREADRLRRMLGVAGT